MTELLNLVFSDRTVWKQMGRTCVLDLLPAGVLPDAGRLQRLRAYGYACMLHIILCDSLPAPMSTVFAYALLHPDGDCEVLNDMKFIRASAPDLMKLLQQWPTMPREFEERKLDPTVRVLAADYFSKTVRPRFRIHNDSSHHCFSLKRWRSFHLIR
ncbi:hypothetical protein B0H10DRAFT_1076486 [Mycena sp. CBHHK59/15]|nr:hypothetical protein B0H10DRAFT_1076486 [Mycena sp. CBHHK59/15]